MSNKSNFSIEAAVANCSGAMEAETISKNEASLKSQMSRRNVFKAFLFIVVSTLLFSCRDGNGTTPDDTKSNSLGFIAPDNRADPFIFTDSKENSLLAFYMNQETGKIKSALFNKDGESLIVRYGINGLPIGMTVDEYYFIFSNYQENSVDITTFNKNKELINKITVKNEDIAQLIKEANSSNLRSGTSDDVSQLELEKENWKMASLGLSALGCGLTTAFASPTVVGSIAIGIACLSALIDHVKYFAETFNENYDKNEYLNNAAEYSGIADLLIGSVDDKTLKPDIAMAVPGLALSVLQTQFDAKAEDCNNLIELINEQSFIVDVDIWDISDCVKIKTVVTGITSNSATIGGVISTEGTCYYQYEGFKVEWGITLGNEKYSDNFPIPLTDLKPSTQYSARAIILLDGNRVICGDIVYFKTLPEEYLDLSTYEMNFNKEGGANSFTINTNLKVTNIYSTQTWCKATYNANAPKTVNITVEANNSTESRIATIWVDAINPATNKKTSKGVLINQECEEESSTVSLANTTWDINAVGLGSMGTITFNSDGTCYQIWTPDEEEGIFNGSYNILTNNNVTFEVSGYGAKLTYNGKINGSIITGNGTIVGGTGGETFNFTATKKN